jgi:archaeal chaperonin
VGVVVEDKMLVPGGGAPEVELALRLREYAATVGGREQLAIEAFADAMEVIPKTLAENAGLDQIDSLVSLRSQHEKGVKSSGLDMETGKPVDMLNLGVVEPLRVKTQAVQSAAEAAVMILRIDDVIASKSGGPGGMPGAGGPGGMPGGMGGEDFD